MSDIMAKEIKLLQYLRKLRMDRARRVERASHEQHQDALVLERRVAKELVDALQQREALACLMGETSAEDMLSHRQQAVRTEQEIAAAHSRWAAANDARSRSAHRLDQVRAELKARSLSYEKAMEWHHFL